MADEGLGWTDVETTGINAEEERLLEVATIVTDLELNILDDQGYQAIVYYSPDEVEHMKSVCNPYVLEMHTKTGLWDKLSSGKLLEQIDEELLAYIKKFLPNERSGWLGGNSITLDRNFINKNLPKVAAHLHYRSLDATSWAGPAQWWFSGLQYRKKTVHSAFSDIVESIEEIKFLRDNMVKPRGLTGEKYSVKREADLFHVSNQTFDVEVLKKEAEDAGLTLQQYVEHNARILTELAISLKNNS